MNYVCEILILDLYFHHISITFSTLEQDNNVIFYFNVQIREKYVKDGLTKEAMRFILYENDYHLTKVVVFDSEMEKEMKDCSMCSNCRSDFYNDVIHCLVNALDYRDHYTKGHSGRVGDMALELSKMMRLDDETRELIHIAGHLHDIGKIGISDYILLKEGGLTNEEWAVMKTHPSIGFEIVQDSSLIEVGQVILQHHERWDGCGYPYGLKGAEIHIAARIIALCDTIDAMSSNRPYRKCFGWDEVRREVKACMGSQFDPQLMKYVDRLIAVWRQFEENGEPTKEHVRPRTQEAI